MNTTTEQQFLSECKARMDASLLRLNHCLDQLNENQIWWRPNEKMNSVGVLVNHICGAFRQWTITQLNNEVDTRDRPSEFLNDNTITKTALTGLVSTLKSDFIAAIDNFDASRLTEQKRIQGFETTTMGALIRALAHLEGHVGQIIVLTRIQLGDDYKIFWVPQTDEQKAVRTAGQ